VSTLVDLLNDRPEEEQDECRHAVLVVRQPGNSDTS